MSADAKQKFLDPKHLSNKRPPIPITSDMVLVKKVISNIKSSKVADPSGKVVETIRAAGDTGATKICDLATTINCDDKVQSKVSLSAHTVVSIDNSQFGFVARQL